VSILIRPGTTDDARFLTDMLVEAANWNANSARPRVAVLADPNTTRYITGWQRPSDRGLIAEDSEGSPVGACWFRLFPQNKPGYGFVAAGVPEITLGVSPIWRAQGVGRALLRETIALAGEQGYQRLSLSVERGNHAQKLYQSEGFKVVASGTNSDTMVRALL
jgi:ribosomal protein S18 acetylase RimI-like enzyme